MKKSNKPVIITSTGLFENFEGLMIDGKIVDTANYTVKSGSTIVTIKPEFLETLKVGNHSIIFLYNDGNIEGTLKVVETQAETETTVTTDKAPKTGDLTNIGLWIVILLGSIGILVFLL